MLPVIKGKVGHLNTKKKRSYVNNSSSQNNNIPGRSRTEISYVTLLNFDGQKAQLNSKTTPFIEVGDEVAVSGFNFFGTMNVFAYKNISQNSISDNSFSSSFIFGAVLLILSFYAT